MSALLNSLSKTNEFQIVIATVAAVAETVKTEQDGVVYYALPDAPPSLYREEKEINLRAWKEMIKTEKPDLIELWGTEFTHGLCALKAADGIPSVVRMQGYLSAIGTHYTAEIPYYELKKSVTIRDRLKRDSIMRQQKKYLADAEKEAEIISLSGNVICQNGWGEAVIKSRHPEAKVYFCPLSINAVFQKYQWISAKAQPHTIICNASEYTLKGLHILLRAVALLKNKYPDIRLYVPGDPTVSDGSLQWILRKRGYTKYIEKLIKELGITNEICWLGKISHEALAKEYSTKSVFVLCSAVENQSSSLIEAMTVGVPCVASAVGEVPEFIRREENGLLYRFGEYDVLAYQIDRLFSDAALAKKLSVNGKNDMTAAHDAGLIEKTIKSIYRAVAAASRNGE